MVSQPTATALSPLSCAGADAPVHLRDGLVDEIYRAYAMAGFIRRGLIELS